MVSYAFHKPDHLRQSVTWRPAVAARNGDENLLAAGSEEGEDPAHPEQATMATSLSHGLPVDSQKNKSKEPEVNGPKATLEDSLLEPELPGV